MNFKRIMDLLFFFLRLKAACLRSDVVAATNSSILFQLMCSIQLGTAAYYIWSNSFLHKLINVCMCIRSHKHPHSACISTQAQTHKHSSLSTCELLQTCISKHASVIKCMLVYDLWYIPVHSVLVPTDMCAKHNSL